MKDTIKKLYIFEGIEEKFLEHLLESSEIKKFKTGDYIIKEGDISEKAYILISGIVQVIKGGEEINNIFEGDIFGEISLVIKEKRTASIKAQTNIEVLEINKNSLLSLMDTEPNGEQIKNTILNRIIMNNSLNK